MSLAGFMSKLSGNADKIFHSGRNKEFFEGACAAAALVAMADGNCSDIEAKTAIDGMGDNRLIQAAGFTTFDITAKFDKMLPKASRYSGRAELMREISEAARVDTSGEMREAIFLIAADVADSENGIGPEEKTRLSEIAAALNIDGKKYGVL